MMETAGEAAEMQNFPGSKGAVTDISRWSGNV